MIVIGAGGHAKVLISILKSLGCEILGITESNIDLYGQTVLNILIRGNDNYVLEQRPESIELVNGLGSVVSTEQRKNIYAKFKSYGYFFSTVVHPSSIVADDVFLGEGVQIMAGAVIQPGCKIGENAIINTGVCIDHDCIVGDHVHLAPGVVLSGTVNIGAKSHIGTSATIIQGLTIGESAIVAAGAVVIRNIPSGVKAMGNPARAYS